MIYQVPGHIKLKHPFYTNPESSSILSILLPDLPTPWILLLYFIPISLITPLQKIEISYTLGGNFKWKTVWRVLKKKFFGVLLWFELRASLFAQPSLNHYPIFLSFLLLLD
jgi:hypothetical protein